MLEFRDALKNTKIFSGLEEAELDILVSCMCRVHFGMGETIFREGEEGDTMYVILDGLVNISVQLADGAELPLATIEKGDFFGDMAIIENEPRSASCKAAQACDLFALSRGDFYNIIYDHPQTALKILYRMMNIMAERVKASGAVLAEMVRWGEEARKKAITDEFTGLFNRRFLDESISTYVSRALGTAKPLSFVMIDMDHFGAINKKHGEAFGDHILLETVKVFKESFNETDILVRYGGDEFSFILPDTDSTEAKELCAAMADRLRYVHFSDHPDVILTLSVGIAIVPENAGNPAALKEAADKAVYMSKERGRDTITIAPTRREKKLPEVKTGIFTIAEKNRIVQNIAEEIYSSRSFLLLAHKEPDADSIASLVAFALILSKYQKEVTIFLTDPVTEQLQYLLAICEYNSITVIQNFDTDVSKNVSTLVVLDTPKPEMVMTNISVARILADQSIRKIEIDHHIGSDASYIGDPGYRLVFAASSTCEIIGYLCLKLAKNPPPNTNGEEFFSRNLMLSILTGIVADSQMGRYLKSRKERWYYNIFSTIFEELLIKKTRKDGKNLQSMGGILDVIQKFSRQEEECFKAFKERLYHVPSIFCIILAKKESEEIFRRYDDEIIVNVSKAAADELSEASGKLGLVAYYDPPRLSDFIQFRLRRNAEYKKLDLRKVIICMDIKNGGGHPGAIGFRIKKSEVKDISAYCKDLLSRIQDLLTEAEKKHSGN